MFAMTIARSYASACRHITGIGAVVVVVVGGLVVVVVVMGTIVGARGVRAAVSGVHTPA